MVDKTKTRIEIAKTRFQTQNLISKSKLEFLGIWSSAADQNYVETKSLEMSSLFSE